MFGAGGHKFDFKIVKKFLETFVFFNIGDQIRLSNGKIAKIIKITMPMSHRPLVKLSDGSLINLLEDKNIVITENKLVV